MAKVKTADKPKTANNGKPRANEDDKFEYKPVVVTFPNTGGDDDLPCFECNGGVANISFHIEPVPSSGSYSFTIHTRSSVNGSLEMRLYPLSVTLEREDGYMSGSFTLTNLGDCEECQTFILVVSRGGNVVAAVSFQVCEDCGE